MLSHDRLLRLLRYDPLTGVFSWAQHHRLAGRKVGSRSKVGYLTICFGNDRYRAHRVAWFYMYGKWPSNSLDHIDGNKTNNAISNLREATHSQNAFNRPVRGYSFCNRQKRYRASIEVNGKTIWLGYHDSVEAAFAAYSAAKEKYAGEFACQRSKVDPARLPTNSALAQPSDQPRDPHRAANQRSEHDSSNQYCQIAHGVIL